MIFPLTNALVATTEVTRFAVKEIPQANSPAPAPKRITRFSQPDNGFKGLRISCRGFAMVIVHLIYFVGECR